MAKNECALRRYLRSIKDCPDEFVDLRQGKKGRAPRVISRLTYDFGISNNWPINLKTDTQEMVRYFRECRRYKYLNLPRPLPRDILVGDEHIFITPSQSRIWIQVAPWIYESSLVGSTEEQEKQKNYYNTGILLFTGHPTTGKGAVETCRRLADVIEDVMGVWVLSQNIPAMLPKTKGWEKRKDLADLNSVVIHKIRRPNTKLSSLLINIDPWLPTVQELLAS